jgi:glycosyltransferase involved in cell wall biosynthesis
MERVMSELVHYFCSKEIYEVHLILYGIKREIFYPIPNEIIIHKPAFEFDNNKRTWHTIKTLWFLRNKVKFIKPDNILSFGELWNNFVLLSTIGLKIPIYVSDRCQPDKSLGKTHNFLRKFLYPKASGIICQTEIAKSIYNGKFNHNNIRVIGNPIRDIISLKDQVKENIVLSVGRLIKTKHFDELIKIFAEINNPNWKLIIVGEDALKQSNKLALNDLIISLGMDDKIELAGKKSDVEYYYNKSKIFAFTSSSEGFPNVIGEAMSAGLPVVAYDCIAGPSDLIEHEKTGFLIPLHNVNAFKEKLELLINTTELRENMGVSAKLSIKRFSAMKINKQFHDFIINENLTN